MPAASMHCPRTIADRGNRLFGCVCAAGRFFQCLDADALMFCMDVDVIAMVAWVQVLIIVRLVGRDCCGSDGCGVLCGRLMPTRAHTHG